jgi:diacylglycerol kinase family enzyme
MKAELPVGCLPLGRTNNIARFLYGTPDPAIATKRILAGSYRPIDTGTAAGQPFFGSVGVGFVARLAEELASDSPPRFALSWSKLGSRVAASVPVQKTVLKVDAFRFETTPVILNVNLLPYSVGLPLSPASLADDGHAEVIFDNGDNIGNFSAFVRQVFKGKYTYGDEIRLYRGQIILWQAMKGRTLYLDGELLEIPTDTVEIRVGPGQLNVFC